MIILLHVVIALSSIVYTSYVFFSPSKPHFRVAYSLVGVTLASGTYLVVSTHASLLPSCMTGLIYLGIVLAGIAAAHRKFALEQTK